MGADALTHVLRPLTGIFGEAVPDLLVGLHSADDAAVYRLNSEQAIVATTDFFPPVVDDPYTFGAIAAANALSDIYAMGGDPLFCLNLVAFPDDLDPAILTDILRGGAEKVREAGAVVAGGHTVTDTEPKYGLAAIGLVHPDRIWTKGGARPGDLLLLTKPLGTGVITTALKHEAVRDTDLAAAVASMTTLNATAARTVRPFGLAIHAATDITGFGLLGHAYEMAEQSAVGISLTMSQIPLLPGALDYAASGHIPGGTQRNRDHLTSHVTFADAITETERTLLFDPQTSGGLLVALAPDAFDAARDALLAAGVACYHIGGVVTGSGIAVA
ncbi:MAG: selenide,water dikinase [Ktedonobacterales bacterium]|jgi:selenide,water dikinase|nr:MAG: selenide,water dikinase [Ktedonobacterales bacterium]